MTPSVFNSLFLFVHYQNLDISFHLSELRDGEGRPSEQKSSPPDHTISVHFIKKSLLFCSRGQRASPLSKATSELDTLLSVGILHRAL